MLSKLIWRFRCYLLKRKWNTSYKTYLNYSLFVSLKKLIETIPDREYDILYLRAQDIPTFYTNVYELLDHLIHVNRELSEGYLSVQQKRFSRTLSVYEFLQTADGRNVSLYEAVEAVMTELDKLYKGVLSHPTEEQEYYQRQLGEVFNTGVRLCICAVEEYELR